MKVSRKFTQTLKEAKQLFKLKTGQVFDSRNQSHSIKIYKLKAVKTKTRKYFVGTHIEWLNLY